MSVFKRYNGKRITSSHPAYAKARWWMYKRLNGKVFHQAIPEATTKQEAELAERQIIKTTFNHNYGVADGTTTLASFIDAKYRPMSSRTTSTRVQRTSTSDFSWDISRSVRWPA